MTMEAGRVTGAERERRRHTLSGAVGHLSLMSDADRTGVARGGGQGGQCHPQFTLRKNYKEKQLYNIHIAH